MTQPRQKLLLLTLAFLSGCTAAVAPPAPHSPTGSPNGSSPPPVASERLLDPGIAMPTISRPSIAPLIRPAQVAVPPSLYRVVPTQLGQRIDADQARVVATHLLEEHADSVEAETGRAAKLTLSWEPPVAYYDHREVSPAAFEFGIWDETGNAGWLFVATSPYMEPELESSLEREDPISRSLEQRFTEKFGALPEEPKYYRFKTMEYALEDLAHPGRSVALASEEFELSTAKQRSKDVIYEKEEDLQLISDRWLDLLSTEPLDTLMILRGRPLAYEAGRLPHSMPTYSQFQLSDGCNIGSAAMAWSMLYGYYETNGIFSTIYGSAEANAEQNEHVNEMARQIHTYLQTSCAATSNFNLGEGTRWASEDRNLGITGQHYSTLPSSTGYWEEAKEAIDAGRPVIAGYWVNQPNGDNYYKFAPAFGYRRAEVRRRGSGTRMNRSLSIKTTWNSPSVMRLPLSKEYDLFTVVDVQLSN